MRNPEYVPAFEKPSTNAQRCAGGEHTGLGDDAQAEVSDHFGQRC